jgi:hypothetical protein
MKYRAIIVEIGFSMGLWPAISIGKKFYKPSFSRASSIGLLNQVGDVNLGVHDFAEFPSVVSF